MTGAGFDCSLGIFLVLELIADSGEITEVQFGSIEGFGLKGVDLRLTLNQNGQRRRNNATDIQGAVIQNGKETGGIDTYQPVCPLTAAGSGEEIIIFLAVLQLAEALGNGIILHRGNPKAEDGLSAAGHLVDIAEDQLTLASGITGVDHIGNIIAVHQLFQNSELLVLVVGNLVLPVCRNDGQIIISPLSVLLIVGIGVCQLSQMSEAPGYDIVPSFHIAILAVLNTQHGGDGHTNRRLLSDYQSFCHCSWSPFLLLSSLLLPFHAHELRGASAETH